MAYRPLTDTVDTPSERGRMERVALIGAGNNTEQTEWVAVEIVVSGLTHNTSGAASANTAAVQAALDFAESAGGGVVVIPVGIYYLNATLLIGSRVVLAGYG